MQIVLIFLYKTDKRSLFGNAIQGGGGGGDDPTTTNDDETEEEIESMKSIYLKRLYLFISTQNQIKNYNKFCHFVFQFNKSSNQFSCS